MNLKCVECYIQEDIVIYNGNSLCFNHFLAAQAKASGSAKKATIFKSATDICDSVGCSKTIYLGIGGYEWVHEDTNNIYCLVDANPDPQTYTQKYYQATPANYVLLCGQWVNKNTHNNLEGQHTSRWKPKKIIEVLSEQSTHAPDLYTRTKIDDLINLMFIHRPIGSNGRHGDGHTPTCGCER